MQHLVIGASSAIAQAIISKLLSRGDSVVAVSRAPKSQLSIDLPATISGQLHWVESDYSESSIAHICAQQQADNRQFHNVFICYTDVMGQAFKTRAERRFRLHHNHIQRPYWQHQ